MEQEVLYFAINSLEPTIGLNCQMSLKAELRKVSPLLADPLTAKFHKENFA